MSSNADWSSKPFKLCSTPNASLPAGQKPDLFEELASGMALTHNIIIRTLNAIHQQAPYVSEADVPSFVGFCRTWVDVLSSHHDGEEETCFPAIERLSGEPGLMNVNVEQHAAFHDNLISFQEYLDACQKDKTKYDGNKTREMLDAFGEPLIQHLHDEIPTLLSLRKYGEDKMKDLPKIFEGEAQQNMSKVGMTGGMMLVFLSHDVTFEDGLWQNWPPVPYVMLLAIRHVIYRFHSDWWRFAPVDAYGKPQPQYAAPTTSRL